MACPKIVAMHVTFEMALSQIAFARVVWPQINNNNNRPALLCLRGSRTVRGAIRSNVREADFELD